jgi:hypothetical protein
MTLRLNRDQILFSAHAMKADRVPRMYGGKQISVAKANAWPSGQYVLVVMKTTIYQLFLPGPLRSAIMH